MTQRLIKIKVDLTLAWNRPEENHGSETDDIDLDNSGKRSYRILPNQHAENAQTTEKAYFSSPENSPGTTCHGHF
jgi:lipopolysaccharide export system protein LptC